MKAKVYIFILLFSAIFCATATAQSKIDKIINDLEGRPDVTTTYTERRTVKGHKLYRTTRILTFTNQNYYKRLVKAFEEERPKTVSATMSNETRSYRFQGDKSSSSYTLSGANGTYSVVMSWRDTTIDDSDDTGCNMHDILGDKNIAWSGMSRDEWNEWADKQRAWAQEQRLWAEQQREFADKMRKKADKKLRSKSSSRSVSTTKTNGDVTIVTSDGNSTTISYR